MHLTRVDLDRHENLVQGVCSRLLQRELQCNSCCDQWICGVKISFFSFKQRKSWTFQRRKNRSRVTRTMEEIEEDERDKIMENLRIGERGNIRSQNAWRRKIFSWLASADSAYSHQENCIVERTNKEVLRHIRTMILKTRLKKHWAEMFTLT